MNSHTAHHKVLSTDSDNCQDKITLFPEDTPRWMSLINIMVVLLLLISIIGFAGTQVVESMRPPRSRLWLLYLDFTYEILWKIGCLGLVLFLGNSILGLIRAISGKLDWNTYLIWLYIHIGFLVLALLVFLFKDRVR